MPQDKFTQIAYLTVIESAAATLTFNGLSVFSNVLGQKGMILHRIEYYLKNTSLAFLNADTKGVAFGLAGSDSISNLSMDDPEVYDYRDIYVGEVDSSTGAAANTEMPLIEQPFMTDFDALPGGGMLVPADRLFLGVKGVNTNNALTLSARVRFTIVDMSPSDYLELAQSLRVLR